MIFNRVILTEDLGSTIDSIRRNCPNIPQDEESQAAIVSLDPTLTLKAGKEFRKNKRGTFTDWLLRLYNKDPSLFNFTELQSQLQLHLLTEQDISYADMCRWANSGNNYVAVNNIEDELVQAGYNNSLNANGTDYADNNFKTEFYHRVRLLMLQRPNIEEFLDGSQSDTSDDVNIDSTTEIDNAINPIKKLLIKFVLFCNKNWLTPPENTIDHYKSINELAATIKATEKKSFGTSKSIDKIINLKPEQLVNSRLSDNEVETWFLYLKQLINPDKELPIVFKDEHYTVHLVNSLRADMLLGDSSDKYGREKAGWCTCVQTSNNYYYNYHNSRLTDPYYVIIDTLNNKLKYQCHLSSNQLFDAVSNNGIPSEHRISFDKFADDPNLIKFFYDKMKELPRERLANADLNSPDENTIVLGAARVKGMSAASLLILQQDNAPLVYSTVLHWLINQTPSLFRNRIVHLTIVQYLVDLFTKSGGGSGYWLSVMNKRLILIDDPQEAESVAEHICDKLLTNAVGRGIINQLVISLLNRFPQYLTELSDIFSKYTYNSRVHGFVIAELDGDPITLIKQDDMTHVQLSCAAFSLYITLQVDDGPDISAMISLLNILVNMGRGRDRNLSKLKATKVPKALIRLIDLAILLKFQATTINELLSSILDNNLLTYFKQNNPISLLQREDAAQELISFTINQMPELYLEYNNLDSQSYYDTYNWERRGPDRHRYIEAYRKRHRRYNRYY